MYLLWIGYILTWLVSFWWWEFRFQELGVEWSYGLYLFVVIYSIALFLLAAVLVPHRMQGVTDSYEYFMSGRVWFFGGNLLVNVIDVVDTFLKGTDWGLRPELWTQTGVFAGASIIGMITTRRWIQLGCAAAAFVTQLWYMFEELGVLGR